MRYFIINLIFITFVNSSFSQEHSKIFDDISEEVSNSFGSEILANYEIINIWCGSKSDINIQMNFLYNANGEQTELSKEMGYRMTKFIQKKLNSVIIRRFDFSVNSPYDISLPTNEKIEKTKESDFTLTGAYTIHNSGITFSRFTLGHIASGNEIILKSQTVNTTQQKLLEEYDKKLLLSNPFNLLMEFNKENVILKNSLLTLNTEEEKKTQIAGIGDVYNTEYDTNYNFEIELAQDAYIYAFLYDPYDTNNNFIWYIDNQNILFNEGKYSNFYTTGIIFTNTGKTGEYSFVKFIVTKNKINIENYYIKKYIDGYEAIIIDKAGCQKLLDDIKTLDNIQTKTIILTF